MNLPCTCAQAYGGITRPLCPTHGSNWNNGPLTFTPPGKIIPDEGPLNDFNKGYRAGVEAAMKLMGRA